ncbi:MAG TPA: spore protease YyaC [Syntrophomonas sp.]|nr:spore protease YyaC [Syntrophomonas sp.]
MMLADCDYRHPDVCALIAAALSVCRTDTEAMPIFVCIGSDRHLLDCFGPLTGTMLQDSIPGLTVCGTLDHPLHARNLTKEMMLIKRQYPGRTFIAVDAAVGEATEIGRLQLRLGPVLPGRAMAKNLPAVGDYSLTAIVGKRGENITSGQESSPGFAPVYHMAKVVRQAVESWYSLYQQ